MGASEDAAMQLAKFLTDRSGYERKSPLDKMLELRITEMTNQIAVEVVAATPELETVIRRKVQELIRTALRDDAYLSSIVVGAVASALGRYAADGSDKDA